MSQQNDLRLLQEAMKKRHDKPKHLHRERIRTVLTATDDVKKELWEQKQARLHHGALRAAALRKQRKEALENPINAQLFALMGITKRDEQLDFLRLRDTFGPIVVQSLADAGFISDQGRRALAPRFIYGV
jgi:hypothetical protein